MLNAVALIRYFCLMEVNDALIDKLANLAKLEFDPSEKEQIKNDLQKMIRFIHKLEEVDTENIPPLLHIGDVVNIIREDVVKAEVSKEAALKNAAVHDGSFFKVPKVIKK